MSLRLLPLLGIFMLTVVVLAQAPTVTAQAGASITVDRAEYRIGDPIRVCYTVPGPGPIRITNILADGRSQVFIEGTDDGRGDCLNGQITPPPGRECLRMDYQSNRGSGSVQTCYTVLGSADGGSSQSQPASLSVSTDRGEGATYYPGDAITICVQTNRSVFVRLTNFVNGATNATIDLGTVNGRQCRNSTISPPLGDEVIRAEALENGRVVATAETRYRSTDRQTTSPTLQVPAAPSNVSVTAPDSSTIVITWSDNSNNEDGFELTENQYNPPGVRVGANTTTYTWGGLGPGTYKCIAVRAVNSAGVSPWSDPWACTTTAASQGGGSDSGSGSGGQTTPPSGGRPPTIYGYPMDATALSATEIRLDWRTQGGAGSLGDGPLRFEVRNQSSTTPIVYGQTSPDQYSFVVTGLEPNTRYCFFVYAFNDYGYSGGSSVGACDRTSSAPVAQLRQLQIEGQSTDRPYKVEAVNPVFDPATKNITFTMRLTPNTIIPYVLRTTSSRATNNYLDESGNVLYWPNFPAIEVPGIVLEPGGFITFEASKAGYDESELPRLLIADLAFIVGRLSGVEPPLPNTKDRILAFAEAADGIPLVGVPADLYQFFNSAFMGDTSFDAFLTFTEVIGSYTEVSDHILNFFSAIGRPITRAVLDRAFDVAELFINSAEVGYILGGFFGEPGYQSVTFRNIAE